METTPPACVYKTRAPQQNVNENMKHTAYITRLLLACALACCLSLPALAGCTVVEDFTHSIDGTIDPADLPEDFMTETLMQVVDAEEPESYHMVGGIDLSRIKAAETAKQIVVVSGHDKTDAHVIFAERTPNGWNCIVDTEGHVGMNGIAAEIDEWSVKTPEGVFGLGFAFGIKENPGTEMEYRQVNENHYWVADPDSDYYNQWVDITETGKVWADGSQTEHLIDYTTPYAYCIFIQYNWPVEGYARSSAIFLHCIGNVYTGGCVSIPEEDMVTILQNIDPEGAIIVIANGEDIYNY